MSPADKRVVVIDDDPAIRDLLFRVLRSKDFQPIVAGDGSKGLSMIEKHKPGNVILDLVMPRMDGYAVLDRMREVGLAGRIKIIILTGVDADRDDLIARGACDVLQKPVSLDNLLGLLTGSCPSPRVGS